MNAKPLLIASLGVALLLALFGWWAAAQMPPGAQLPTHWNAAGEADAWMPASSALMVAPIMLAVTSLIFAAIPRMEPLQDRLEASAPVLRASWIGMIGLMVFLQGFIAAPVFGIEPRAELIMVAVGLLFVALGNWLPKSRPGFFVGIRTPWTLTDTDNWIATHRLGGKCFMIAGSLMIVLGLIDIDPAARSAGMFAAVAIAALVPIAYSWWFWRQAGATGTGGDKR